MFRKFLLSLAASLALAGCTAIAPAAPLASASTGVAAANDPRAGEIGEAIMARGGSATDAAIAMMLALAVIEPQSSGIGGGAFYVRGGADGTVATIDGRERAPIEAREDWFLLPDGTPRDRTEATLSGLSIGVPGALALAAEAHQRHGRLRWAELFAPAIVLARDGFAVTPRLSSSLASAKNRAGRDPDALAMFYGADGEAPPAGSVLRLPELADTLEMLAAEGAESFYAGPLAQELAAEIAADTPRAQRMTRADIATYEAIERPPVCTIYRLHRICSMGPPSAGGVSVLAMLKQLERFDLAALGLRNAATWHLFSESQRLAFADRDLFFGDSDFVAVPLGGLLADEYMAARSALIDPAKVMEDAPAGVPLGLVDALAPMQDQPEHGTTHFVAVDGEGNMVSLTATVEGAFGSGLMVRGFFLNNELTDFAMVPVEGGAPVANRVEGGKRPRSSMSPTVVYDPQGEPLFVVGAAGGMLIPIQTARAIIGVVDFGLPLEQALGLPFVMSARGALLVERGTWMEELAPGFAALGHTNVVPFGQLLRTTGALNTANGWVAAHDPRLIELVRIPDEPEERATEAVEGPAG